MKSKKVLTLLLAAVMTASIGLSGCGNKNEAQTSNVGKEENLANLNETGLPLVKETETLKVLAVIKDGQHASEDSVLNQEMETATNVHIDWEDATHSAWQEKKGLKMSSGELPDVIMGNDAFTDSDLLTYGQEGLVVPIEDMIEKYAPNLNQLLQDDPELRKQITASDGHIYAVPCYDDGFKPATSNVIYINKQWLDKLGLAVPATYDELYEVLKAFKTQDPNGNGKADEIPMSFVKDAYASDWFASFGVVDDNNPNHTAAHIGVSDGKVIYTALEDGYKEAVKYFNKLFSEGLVDQEAFTQDSAMFNSKLKAYPERLVGVFTCWRSTSWKAGGQTEDDYIAIPPMEGPNGVREWPKTIGGLYNRGSFMITASCRNPELALRWADNFISEENSIQYNLNYKLGTHLNKTDDGKYEVIKVPNLDDPNELKMNNGGSIWVMTKDIVNKFVTPPPHMVEKFALDEIYKDYYPDESRIYPNVFFTQEEMERIGQMRADIIPYTNGKYAEWMMKGGIDQQWEEYTKQLEAMGLSEYLNIFQQAYDRYNRVETN